MDGVLFGENGKKKHEDRLADFTRDIRILLLAAMALPVGAISAVVAYALVWLIGAMTNLAFYQRLSAEFVSPTQNHLGLWVILVPVIGGLIIGLMARYGSEKIRGHGIPEALEAILIEKEHEREPGWLIRFAQTATSETEAKHDEHRKAA